MKNKAWLILAIIALVAAIALSATNLITKDRIAEQAAFAANAARSSAMPAANAFEEQALAEGAALDSLYAAMDGTTLVGYVGQATVTGFGGPIEVVLGVDVSGKITGMSVGGSDFAETAGLGDETRKPEFTDQFIGLTQAPELKANVDAISGATISSSAVTNGAKSVYNYVLALTTGGEVPVAEQAIPLTVDDRRTVTTQGRTDSFDVTVGVNADGSIEAIEIKSENAKDDAAYIAMAGDPAFLNQFAGKTAPLAYGDGLDAISGATITSDAVLAAVNEAFGFETAKREEAPGEWQTLDAPDSKGAVKLYVKTVMGMTDEFTVTVGVDAEGKIVSIKISGKDGSVDEYYLDQVKANSFRKQFVGLTAPAAYGEGVDAISGATISSDAVLSVVNEALEK